MTYPQVAGVQGDGGLGMEGLDLPTSWIWEGEGLVNPLRSSPEEANSNDCKSVQGHVQQRKDYTLVGITEMFTSYQSSPARSCEEGGNKSLSPGLQGLSTGLYISQGQEQSLGRDVIHCVILFISLFVF